MKKLQWIPALGLSWVVLLWVGALGVPSVSAQQQGTDAQVLRVAIEWLVDNRPSVTAGYDVFVRTRFLGSAPELGRPLARYRTRLATREFMADGTVEELRRSLSPDVAVCVDPTPACYPPERYLVFTLSEPTIRGDEARVMAGLIWGKRLHHRFVLHLQRQQGQWVVTESHDN